ncbi:MAG: hypothetical protein ABI480_06430 [Chitinophagaceae bacterium]
MIFIVDDYDTKLAFRNTNPYPRTCFVSSPKLVSFPQIPIFIAINLLMRSFILSILLVIFCSHSILAQQITQQEAEVFADKLLKTQILSAKGKELLLQRIKEKKIEVEHRSTVKPITYTTDSLMKETILEFCSRAFINSQVFREINRTKTEQQIVPEDSMIRQGWTIYPPLSALGGRRDGFKYDNIHPKRSTFGQTRTRTLNDFKSIGLISDLVYKDCMEGLKDSSLNDEPELVSYMAERSIYYHYYDFNKKEQEEYIDGLVEMGLLTTEARQHLLDSYKTYELKTIPEMLEFSKRYVLIDLSDQEPVPAKIYPLIFEKLKAILPEFQYQHLITTVLEKKDKDLIREDVKLSFTDNGNTYTHVFFHDYRHEKFDPIDTESITRIDQDFHKIINKWLADKESDDRLYTLNISHTHRSPYGGKAMGFLLLKKGEAKKIATDPYIISDESFDPRLSRKNLGKFIDDFSNEGFFSHLSKAEMDSAIQRTNYSDIGSPEEILLLFPKTIVVFDWETDNLENPYADLTNQFAKASRGAFTPTAIVDEFKEGFDKKAKTIRYGFSFNNKRYEKILPFSGDWIQAGFLELIMKSLKENKVDGGIYYCVDNGQEVGYIFLTAKQHQFVLEKYPDLIKE